MTANNHRAVIAGVLAPGTRLGGADLTRLPDLFRASFQAVNRLVDGEASFRYEIIRMDEFLAICEAPEKAMRSLLMLLSAFRFLASRELKERLELQASLGLGPIEFEQEQLRESDGTALRHATGGLENMKRNHRLSVRSDNKAFNEEYDLSCRFMDILLNDWSDEQAEALFLNLSGKKQSNISTLLKISQPAVNRRLKAAHADTVLAFTKRYEYLIPNGGTE